MMKPNIIYPVLALSLSLFSYLFIDRNLSYLQSLHSGIGVLYRLPVTIAYVILVLCFFGAYILSIRSVKTNRIALPDVIKILFIVGTALLFAYPAFLSYDIFNYIATAKVLFVHGENPYIMMPIDFPNDPLLQFTRAANKVALYGPVWILMSGIPLSLGFGNFILTLVSFKLLTASFFFGTAFLIWKITKNAFSPALFALNPLVLIEVIASGHNDVAMMFFAVLAFYFLIKKQIVFAALFLGTSILIKYATLFLLPVFLYGCWKIIRKKQIHTTDMFYYATLSMYVIFLLSPLREEMYPWYTLWFFSFAVLIPERKNLLIISVLFSFVMTLRYIPFMATGNYFGNTPIIREALTFLPVIMGLLLLRFYKKWLIKLLQY